MSAAATFSSATNSFRMRLMSADLPTTIGPEFTVMTMIWSVFVLAVAIIFFMFAFHSAGEPPHRSMMSRSLAVAWRRKSPRLSRCHFLSEPACPPCTTRMPW